MVYRRQVMETIEISIRKTVDLRPLSTATATIDTRITGAVLCTVFVISRSDRHRNIIYSMQFFYAMLASVFC